MKNKYIQIFWQKTLPLALGLGLLSTNIQAGKSDIEVGSEIYPIILAANSFRGKPPYYRAMKKRGRSKKAQQSVDLFALEIEADTANNLTQGEGLRRTGSYSDPGLIKLKKKIGGHPDRVKRFYAR